MECLVASGADGTRMLRCKWLMAGLQRLGEGQVMKLSLNMAS